MGIETSGGHLPKNATLINAVGAIHGDPSIVCDFSKFEPLLETVSPEEADRLRYFAMAKVLTDRAVKRVAGVRELYPPFGLPDYRIGPVGMSTFIPTGGTFRATKWEVLRDTYADKMRIVLGTQLMDDQDSGFSPLVSGMASHPMPNYHVNTMSIPREAYERMGRQLDNAVDVMIGLLHLLPSLKGRGQDLVAIAGNSKDLAVDMSNLSMTQLQHLLHEILKGKRRVPGYDGWHFNPAYFQIEETLTYPKGRLTTKVPLRDIEVTYPITKVSGPDQLDVEFEVAENIPRLKLKEIEPTLTSYGCPAFRLTEAMWSDLVYIIEKSRFFNLRTTPQA